MIPSQVLGELHSGLYAVEDKSHLNHVPEGAACTATLEDAKLWHLRLGHMPFNKLHFINSCFSNSVACDTICQICPKARQPRISFPKSSSSRTSKPFALLHVDVWGPYQAKTHDVYNMFLTVVDDFTRHTWVFLMKQKSDSTNILSMLLALIETQFNTHVLCIRTDNAKELCEGSILQLYRAKGILHQRSCTDSPQQNGVVERKHRHLLETARALFFQSRVPTRFWGECLLCATHLINRMTLSSVNFQSPYELLYGHKPSLTHLKVFGCLCYVSTIKAHRSKFEPRALSCIFLGYPSGQKAYRVYDLENHKFLTSRDVIFHEKHLPYHFSSTPSYHNFDPSSKPISSPIFLPSHTHFNMADFPDLPDSLHISPPSPSQPTSPISIPTSSPSIILNTTSLPPPRLSTRSKHAPKYLDSYVCTAQQITSHWCNLVLFDDLPQSVKALISNTCSLVEPTGYLEASQDDNWVQAMQKELTALEQTGTWELVPLPKGKKAIGCK